MVADIAGHGASLTVIVRSTMIIYHILYLSIMEIRRNTSAVYEVAYHVVWCPKYRSNLPVPAQATVRTTIQAVAQARDWEIKEMEIMPDHIHLFLSAPPTDSPTGIVKVLKGITGHTLLNNHPELRKQFRHGHVWSPSYYVGTVGNVSEETVARYVRDQKLRTVGRPSKKRLASSPQQVGGSPLAED